MNSRKWILLVSAVVLLTLISFLFLFTQGKSQPMLGSVPYVFWVSFLATCLVVIFTFLGSRVFPHLDSKGK
ncbi:MAG: hypothetical protein LPK25_14630 [Cyclobacteriaceae bacterium]|nr:hypothetical protein [Cyclobacteriaceae bacterium]MDX5467713.1 hypothetical protein [Cyclobacteriaceae bacterium]